MRVLVKAIAPSQTIPNNMVNLEHKVSRFIVSILLDNQEYLFNVDIEVDRVDGKNLQVVTTDSNFNSIFKYDLKIHGDICKLVSQVYNNQLFILPADFGEIEDISLTLNVS
jgi:hypothetical protein